jgi:hypothetical protein
MSKPVSKYAFSTTGSVPQEGPVAVALADGEPAADDDGAPAVAAAGVADGVTAPGGAHAAARLATAVTKATRATHVLARRWIESMLTMASPPRCSCR